MNTYWKEVGLQPCSEIAQPRKYFELTALTIEKMHARSGPFVEGRWKYISSDLSYIEQYLSHCGVGSIADLGCGEGGWIDHYIGSATHLTLIDYSPLLLKRAVWRARRLKPSLPIEALTLDVFSSRRVLPITNRVNTVFCAFLLSHYSVSQISNLLSNLCKELGSGSQIIVMDSWYSPIRMLRREREGIRFVESKDGNASILKRYFTRQEWASLAQNAGLTITTNWWGNAFFLSHCST